MEDRRKSKWVRGIWWLDGRLHGSVIQLNVDHMYVEYNWNLARRCRCSTRNQSILLHWEIESCLSIL